MSSSTPWQTLFHQLLSLARSQATQAPEALTLAKQWEAFQSQFDQNTHLSQEYQDYYANTPQDTRNADVDLVDQQKWYDALQEVQLFVQDVLKQEG